MNYSMIVNAATAPQGINLRSGPATTYPIIGSLNAPTATKTPTAEGDEMIVDALGRKWLNILMIDGMQVSAPTYGASWLCDVTVNPPAPVYPDIRIDFVINSNQTARCIVYTNDAPISDVTVPFGPPTGG